MDTALPTNIRVSKHKCPKYWAYPVKTTELVKALSLDKDPSLVCTIVYWNEASQQLARNHKGLFSIHTTIPSKLIDHHRFISIYCVRPKWRPELHNFLETEVFPKVPEFLNLTGSINSYYSVIDENTIEVSIDSRKVNYLTKIISKTQIE
jgi:hypothetical protein